MSGSRPTVNIRIGTEGADKVKRDLEAIGAEGERAGRRIQGATSAASPGLQNLAGLSDSAATAVAGLSSRLGVVGSALTGAAAAGAGLGVAIGAGLSAAIRGAEQLERLTLRTEAIIKATGGAAGLSAQQIRDLANEIEDTTLAAGDAVERAAGQLLTFRSVAGDTFARTLRAAQDLAAVGFGTIESATVQLGKALENPKEGLSALTRVGVSFSAAQKELIETLVATGRAAEAQGMILAAVERQVGGAGEAEASGLAGAYHRLTANVDGFLEIIGQTGPIQAATWAMDQLGKAMAGLTSLITPATAIQAAEAAVRAAEQGLARVQAQNEAQRRASAYGDLPPGAQQAERAAYDDLTEALARLQQLRDEATRAQAERQAQSEAAQSEIRREAEAVARVETAQRGVATATRSVGEAAKEADAHVQAFHKAQEESAEKAAKAAERAADDLKRYQSRSYDELVNIGERAFDRLGDALVDAFTQGSGAAVNFGNIARAIAASVVTDFAKLAIINPLLNSVFTASAGARPTLAAAMGGGGGGATVDLLGLSSLFPKDGILSSLGLTGSGGLLSTPLIGGGGFSGFAAGAAAPSVLTVGGLLGGLGMGAGVGGLLAGLTGGNAIGGSIGGGIGGAGAAALAAIPAVAGFLGPLAPLAPILGGLLGGGLGGLFGPGESVRGYGYRLEAADDGLLRMGASFYNPEGEAAFRQASAGIDALNAWMGARGITVGGAASVGGNRFGGDLSNATATSFGQAASQLYYHASDPTLQAALSARGNQFGSVEALQQFVDGFGQVQAIITALTAEPIPAFTAQMRAVNDNFAAAAAQAREYGIATDALTAAQARAVAELEAARAETLRQADANLEARLLAARGDVQGAELARQAEAARVEMDAFGKSLEALGLAAEDRTARLIRLEEVQAAERAAIITRFGQQTVAALDTAFRGSAVLRDLAYGSGSALAPEQRFFAAISDLNAAGRTLAGGGALADYEAVARQVLPVARDFLGTSTRYGALANEVAQAIGAAGGDPSNLAAIIQSQTRAVSLQGEAAIAIAGASHAQLESMNEQIGALARSIETLAAMVQAQMTRTASAA